MNGSEIHSKAIVIATGVDFKKLEIPGLDTFAGAGVYYGAAAVRPGLPERNHLHRWWW